MTIVPNIIKWISNIIKQLSNIIKQPSNIIKWFILQYLNLYSNLKMKGKKQSNQFSLFQTVMIYLIKINQVISNVKIAISIVDIIQFITIQAFIILQVYCYYQQKYLSDILNPVLNMVFNYQNVYIGLIILGAVLGVIVSACLILFLIFFQVGYTAQRFPHLLKYCVIVSAVSIGLFEVIFQMMVNNLINIFQSILNGNSKIDVSIVSIFLFNIMMMIFVSVFNSDQRIFGVFLIVVSIFIQIMPLLITYLAILGLALVFYRIQPNMFKRFLYSQLIITSIWGIFQLKNSFDSNQNISSFKTRIIYLCLASIGSMAIHLLRKKGFDEISATKQNKQLVNLYIKKTKKQDKIQDYYDAQVYFNNYLQRSFLEDTQTRIDYIKPTQNYEYVKHNVADWPIQEFLSKLIQKISYDAEKQHNVASIIQSFQLKLDLGVKNISMLKEAFQFISQKQNENIYVKYLIIKLTNKIQVTFSQSKSGDQMSKLNEVFLLQKIYQKFYESYDNCIIKLVEFYENLNLFKGIITKDMQENFVTFTNHKNILDTQIALLTEKVGVKVQNKLASMLNQICKPYQKKQKLDTLLLKKNDEKLNISYLIITNKKITYSSIKFMQKFHYNKDYIINQNISQILPSRFDRYLWSKVKQNQESNKFNVVLPILNEFGLFNIFTTTFHLLPQLNGQITFAVLINKMILQNEKQNNLILFNCETFSVQYFNCQIIQNYSLSMQKIKFLQQTKTIQFEDIFSSNNPQKQGIIFSRKTNQKQQNSLKAIFKSTIISQYKKSIQEEVIITIQNIFQIQRVVYKVLKITTNNIRRKKEIQLKQKTNLSSSSLQVIVKNNVITKDLKKKYQDETFFCPIVNPYKLKILQKLQTLEKPKITNHLNIIRVTLLFIVIIFLGCSIALTLLQTNKKVYINTYKAEAQSLNTQYESVQNALYHISSIYHLRHYNQSFIKFLDSQFSFNQSYAVKLINQSIAYRLNQKDKALKTFSQNYFDYPNLPGQNGIPYTINYGSFAFETNSQLSTIYDVFTWLIDESNIQTLKLICTNYNSIKKIAPFYLPQNRYEQKIQNLNTSTYILIGTYTSVILILTAFIFVLFYQIKDIKRDILHIYVSINHKQINKIKHKLSVIQQLLALLKNTYSSNNELTDLTKQTDADIQSINTFNSLNKLNQKRLSNTQDNVKHLNKQKFHSNQDESQAFLQQNQQFKRQQKKQQEKEIQRNDLSILFQTFLQNKSVLLLLFGVFFMAYQFYSYSIANNQQYKLAFNYIQKVNSINIQFRVQTNTFYMYPLYYDIVSASYVDDDRAITTQQQTSFKYQTPDAFTIKENQNMCATENTAQILDPLISWQNCSKIDLQIFNQKFGQAFSVYQFQLNQLYNSSYLDLIINSTKNKQFFSIFYQYETFQSYLHKIINDFNQNLQSLHYSIQKNANILLGFIIAFLIVTLIIIYKKSISQLIDESHLLIQLLKMVPEDVLFSIKNTKFFKSKSVLQKIQRL